MLAIVSPRFVSQTELMASQASQLPPFFIAPCSAIVWERVSVEGLAAALDKVANALGGFYAFSQWRDQCHAHPSCSWVETIHFT